LSAFLSKDIIFILRKLGWCKVSHVLNHTQHGHVDLWLAEHLKTLLRIGDGYFLWCCHDYGARYRQHLYHGQVDVGCSRRKVEEQVVQFAPLHIRYELLERRTRHRATPDHSMVRRRQETDGHQFHAIFLNWDDVVFAMVALYHTR